PSGDSRPVDVFFPGAAATDLVEAEVPPGDGDGTASDRAATEVADGGATRTPESTRSTSAVSAEVAPTSADHGSSSASGSSSDAGTPAEAGQASDPTDEVELVPVPGAYFADLEVGSIRPNPRQPRTVFDE